MSSPTVTQQSITMDDVRTAWRRLPFPDRARGPRVLHAPVNRLIQVHASDDIPDTSLAVTVIEFEMKDYWIKDGKRGVEWIPVTISDRGSTPSVLREQFLNWAVSERSRRRTR